MSTAALQSIRHPLGLPQGYVRTVLALMTVGLSCGLIGLSTPERVQAFPLFLLFLLLLIYPNYIETMFRIRAHGHESVFAWFIRFVAGIIILIAPVITVVWKLNHDPEALRLQLAELLNRLQYDIQNDRARLLLVGGLVWGGYVVGVTARYVSQHTRHVFYEQGEQAVLLPDVIAWISLLAMVGMTIMLMILLINTNLQEHAPIEMSGFGDAVAGIAAFYFGVRSGS